MELIEFTLLKHIHEITQKCYYVRVKYETSQAQAPKIQAEPSFSHLFKPTNLDKKFAEMLENRGKPDKIKDGPQNLGFLAIISSKMAKIASNQSHPALFL